jgi:hypothetical protein
VDTGKWLTTSRGTRFPDYLKEYCLPGAAGVKLHPRKHFIRTQKAWPNLGRGWAVFACTSLLSLLSAARLRRERLLSKLIEWHFPFVHRGPRIVRTAALNHRRGWSRYELRS